MFVKNIKNLFLKMKKLFLFILICLSTSFFAQKKEIDFRVDYKTFLSKHDLLWDIVPDKWQTAPYTGNGNIGFLLYQADGEEENVISLHIGRHDYYDHREAKTKAEEMLWIKRSRLPLGHFKLKSILLVYFVLKQVFYHSLNQNHYTLLYTAHFYQNCLFQKKHL